jgi:hypothetical protein
MREPLDQNTNTLLFERNPNWFFIIFADENCAIVIIKAP